MKKRQKKDFFAIGTEASKLKTAIGEASLDSSSIQAWTKCMTKGCLYATARLGK